MTRSFSKECDSKCSAKSRALIGFSTDIWLIMPEYHDEIIGKLYHWDMAQYSSICLGKMSIVMTGVLRYMTRVHVTILSIWGGAGSISAAGSYLPAPATCNVGVIGFLFSVLWQRSCAKDTIVCKQFAKLFHNRCTWMPVQCTYKVFSMQRVM